MVWKPSSPALAQTWAACRREANWVKSFAGKTCTPQPEEHERIHVDTRNPYKHLHGNIDLILTHLSGFTRMYEI